MAATVYQMDHGADALLEAAERLRSEGLTIEIGVMGAEAAEAHDSGFGTVAEIASVHEFGLGNSPQRSYVRGYADERTSVVLHDIRRLTRRMLEGQLSIDAAAELLILKHVAGMQERISDGIPPDNAPATKRRKAGSATAQTTPLIDTGQLRSSITGRRAPKGGTK